MMDTLCRTISRSAPAMATPPTSACLMADKNPNRMNATRMDSSVSDVRSFFRFRLHQMRWKNFMRWIGVMGRWTFEHRFQSLSLREERAGREPERGGYWQCYAPPLPPPPPPLPRRGGGRLRTACHTERD